MPVVRAIKQPDGRLVAQPYFIHQPLNSNGDRLGGRVWMAVRARVIPAKFSAAPNAKHQYLPAWVMAEFASMRASRSLRIAALRSGDGGAPATMAFTASASAFRIADPASICSAVHS